MSDDLPDSLIPYDEIVQEALRAVVGRVLGEVEHSGGLPGTHHFYITFKTQATGVEIPKQLVERFPASDALDRWVAPSVAGAAPEREDGRGAR